MQWDWFTIQKILKKQNKKQPKFCHLLKDYFKELILILNIGSRSQNPRMGQAGRDHSRSSGPTSLPQQGHGRAHFTFWSWKRQTAQKEQTLLSLKGAINHTLEWEEGNYASSGYFSALSFLCVSSTSGI